MAYAQDPLDAYRWQNRVVVIVADAHAKDEFARQHQALLGDSDGVQDRDLIVVTVDKDSVEIDGVASQSIRANRIRGAFGIPEQGFYVLLIGKDGGVKLRSNELVTIEDLFTLIDGMPMRQKETA